MVSRNMSNRVKAIAVAAVMCLSATAMTIPSTIKTNSIGVTASAAAINQKLAVDGSYKGMTADIASSGIKTVTISVTPDFTGNFSYGFGIGTAESPYWYEWDGKSWVDTKGGTVDVPGTEVAVTAGQETTISIDVSSLNLKYKDQYDSQYDGTFEFRNYYGGSVTVNSITANGASEPSATTPTNSGNSSTSSGTTLTDDSVAKTNVYRGFTSDLASSDIKSITIVLDTNGYSGNFSYGFGIGIADSPYWMEYNGTTWVDTSDGSEVPGVNVNANGEVSITIDTSSLKLKYKDEYNSEYDGEFEFRNYYSGGNTVSIKSITANASPTTTPDPTEPTNPTNNSNPSTSVGSGTVLTDDSVAKTNVYRGFTSDLAPSDIKSITVTLDAGSYSGNFSYGFGISIADSPYWMEYDGKSWVDTSDGSEVPGTDVNAKGQFSVTIDTSSLKLKYKDEYNSEYDGEFEFRNYYSGSNPVTIVSIVANAEPSTEPTEPSTAPTEPSTAPTEPSTAPTEPSSNTGDLKVTDWGDADESGETDILDVILINKVVLGKDKLSAQGNVNADTDESGNIQANDALNVMKLIVELLTTADFPVK